MNKQRLKGGARTYVHMPADVLTGLDRMAEIDGVSRATIITRLLREGVRRAGAKEAA